MMPITIITNKTRPVNCRASGQVGQETLRSSPVVSRKNACSAFGFAPLSFTFTATINSFIILTAKTPPYLHSGVAILYYTGQAGLEPTTARFGDECSTN